MTNLVDGQVVATDLTYTDLAPGEFSSLRLEPGDVLFNRTNSFELVGRSGLFDLPGDYIFASYLVRLRPTSELLPEYLNLFINSSLGQARIRVHVSRGVSQANISASKLCKVAIVVPSLDDQRAIVGEYGELSESVGVARLGVDATRALANELRQVTLGAE
jgi:restriction endonuclease S subunit